MKDMAKTNDKQQERIEGGQQAQAPERKPRKKADHPAWALAQKRPGTELRLIRGHYYLYECSSFYDKEKKRTRKKSGDYLGRVTEQGLIPPRRKHAEVENAELEAKTAGGRIEVPEPEVGRALEYGLSSFIAGQCGGLVEDLKESFPGRWNRVMALAYCRLRDQSPLKCVADDFAGSHLSLTLGTEGLSARTLTGFLRDLGRDRPSILSFMKKGAGKGGNVIFDGTDMLSSSVKMDFPRMSKTKLGGFEYAVNVMMAFSTSRMQPIYYRLLPGNVKDVTAFLTCLDELADPSMTVIADKGFYSKRNVDELERRGVGYIIALRRNTSGLDYGRPEDGHFFYDDRLIKYSTQQIDGRTVYLFRDPKLAAVEEADYMRRVDDPDKPEYTMQTYAAKAGQFGTLAVMAAAGTDAQKAYNDYKTRCEVEQENDVLKTDLGALTSYMQDNNSLEGWMFINHIALRIFYAIRRRVAADKALSAKLSTRDAIRVMTRAQVVNVNGKWRMASMSKKDRAQLQALGVPVT